MYLVAQVGVSAAFGGGILSSLLLQDPVQAPIALFAADSVGWIWTTCWWLMNYFPFGLIASLHSLLPVRLVSKVCCWQAVQWDFLLLPKPLPVPEAGIAQWFGAC